MLGWNPGNDQEIFSLEELVQAFSFEKCSKSGAKFDYEKGKWFNHQYIELEPLESIVELFKSVLLEHGIKADDTYTTKVVDLVRERVSFVQDIWNEASFFFLAPQSYDEKVVKKRWKEDSPMYMSQLIEVVEQIEDFSAPNQDEVVKNWIKEKEYSMGAILPIFRLAIVGELAGPDLFEITATIGKEETIARLKSAIANIK